MKPVHEIIESSKYQRIIKESNLFSKLNGFVSNVDGKKVYAGQQAYCDYNNRILEKFKALNEFNGKDLKTYFLFIDYDSVGSDKSISKFYLPYQGRSLVFSLASKKDRAKDSRFVFVSQEKISGIEEKLKTILNQYIKEGGSKGVLKRMEEYLVELRNPSNIGLPLSEVNINTTTMLTKSLGIKNNIVYLSMSDFLEENIERITATYQELLNQREDFIKQGNIKITQLKSQGLDPVLKQFASDYLPFFMACKNDGIRLKLKAELKKSDLHAKADCKCGYSFDINLGDKKNTDPSQITFNLKDHWSPDVTLPVVLNNFFSGRIVGKSSAGYGVILNHLTKTILKSEPIPSLVAIGDSTKNSLLNQYFFGDLE